MANDPLKAALLEKAKREKARRANGRQVIATTDDGGQVFKMSDGSLAFKSAGYATNDQERIAEIMKGAKPADLMQGDIDRERIAANPIAARVQEFNQGAPLAGEYLEEAVGMVSPKAADNMRSLSDAMERQHPGQSAALNIAGGIAYTAPLVAGKVAGKAAEWIGKAGSKVGTAFRAGAVAAPAASIEGAVSMAGRGETAEERKDNAIVGGTVGGVLGAVGGPMVSAIGAGTGALLKRAKRLDVRAIASEFGISLPAAGMVKKALMADDLDAAAARLAQLGDDAMLADAGPATGALLDAGTATGGKALATARNAVDGRANEVGQRLTGTLDNILGKPVGIKTAAKNIAVETSPARKAAYDAAFSNPINYADKTGQKIEGILSRIPSKTLQSAISEANEAMQELGERNLQILAKIADDGSVVFQEMPNVRQLNEIKIALGTIGRESVDKYGRPTAAGARARRLAKSLGAAIGDAVPSYKTAVKLGGDKLQRDDALDLGRKLLWKNTTVEDVVAVFSGGISKEARKAAQQGIRETIEQTLSNVKRTITDPNVDAREAMQLVKEVSSRANKKKLTLVLGKKKANLLLDELDKTATALELRAAISANSKTAIRQAIQEEGAAAVQPGLARRTAGNMGNPLDAAKEVTKSAFGVDAATLTESQRSLLGEVAEQLVSVRGAQAQQALTVVRKALAGQPLRDAETKMLNQVLSGSIGVGGHRATQQSLAVQ